MDVHNVTRVTRISPCDFQNGNYNHNFQKNSNVTYSKVKILSFHEIFENELIKKKN